MTNFSPCGLLFWFLIAIFLPGIIVHLLRRRFGPHHWLDRDGLTKEQIRKLPLDMVHKRTKWGLKGSVAAFAGLLIAVGILVGLQVDMFGVSGKKLLLFLAGVIVLLITLGPALVRRFLDR